MTVPRLPSITPAAPLYVPLSTVPAPASPQTRLICFYLPQFHPIPENDAWWGPGFTEWDNVRAARPRFAGHYQPHMPGELGYYTLPGFATQRRQVELAKQYGIGGFCFYFYWFGGKTLLEAPLSAYRDQASLDLPYCLCWANENWTRKWDGLDHEVLIAQRHSPDDDLAFIAHVASYLRDPRAIRVDGKPLLVVYRPGLMPAPRETAARWRQWCHANGIGDICLACTQAFDQSDPALYGFDFAIEFAPVVAAPADITQHASLLDAASATRVYDLATLADYSRDYPPPAYPLWRGVCPSWDNSARRDKGAAVFLNTPERYREWLANAIDDTRRRFSDPTQRLVFINAWNEWGEGAHLEPDARYGYAWLAATRDALNGAAAQQEAQTWNIAIDSADGKPARNQAARLRRPLFSIVMPVYNTPTRFLNQAIESVRRQSYTNWELCICDDGSTAADTHAALTHWGDIEPRIRILRPARNAGIAAATNIALSLASGDFVALLDHDDELSDDALACVALALEECPSHDLLYSDQDKIDADGRRFDAFYKPDWSPDYFRRVMYLGHLLVFRRSLLLRAGKFDPAFDHVQDYEFALRLVEKTQRVHHIPRILYHWRAVPGSVALDAHAKCGIAERQADAVAFHLHRLGLPGRVRPHPSFAHRVLIEPAATTDAPLVSIVIPSKDAPEHIGRCLDAIFARSTYPNFEVVIVDNGTTDARALGEIGRHPVHVVPYPAAFNYSRANNLGVAAAHGEVLVLLNNDTEVVTPDWIESLLLHLTQDDVAAVGPLLLYPDGTVQHAGVVLGCRGTADHAMRRQPGDADGYAGSLSVSREVSAVTAACLMCRRTDYLAAGGMNEYFATHYQDVDFCLRLTAGGRRILFVPQARLTHFESATRGAEYDYLDRLLLLDRWGETIAAGDPYYNRNLSLERLDYSIAAAAQAPT